MIRRSIGSIALSLALLLISLTACATPREQAFYPPDSTPVLQERSFVTGNHAELPLESWLPDSDISAVIIALHGFNDYRHAFAMPGEWLRSQGIAVYAYDQRGFGETDKRGIWAGKDNLVSDLGQAITAARKHYPHAPLFIMGESMGGAVLLAAMEEEAFPGNDISGVILVAPAIWGEETLNPFYRAVLWAIAHTFPSAEFTGEGLKIKATDNIDILREMGRDPNIIKSSRADAIYGMAKLMDYAYSHIDKVDKIPVLILYGKKDQVIPPLPIKNIAGELMKNEERLCRVVYYPQGYHMLLRDLHALVVWQDIAKWVGDPYGQLPSGYELGYETFLAGGKAEKNNLW